MFQLGGALAPSLPELEIGPWTRTLPDIAAFDAAADQPASLWRVDFARDDAANRAALAGGERSVTRALAVLDEVPRRLDRVIDQTLAELALAARPKPAPGDHGQVPAPELPKLESDLVAALVRTEAHLSPKPGAPPPSEGSPQPPGSPSQPAEPNNAPGSSARVPGRLERAIHSIGDLARGRAHVETHLEGVLVAVSVTTLSGDTELWVVPRLSQATAELHARSVAVALRTRHAWARVLALIVACCGRFAALGMLSGGLAALPLVWRFLRDVLCEGSSPSDVHSGAAPAAAQ
jgi:hypothetical protein